MNDTKILYYLSNVHKHSSIIRLLNDEDKFRMLREALSSINLLKELYSVITESPDYHVPSNLLNMAVRSNNLAAVKFLYPRIKVSFLFYFTVFHSYSYFIVT